MSFITLLQETYEHTFEHNGETKVFIFSAATLGDLADFCTYYKFLPFHELKDCLDDFPKSMRNKLLADKFTECSKRKSIITIPIPAPVEKDETGLPVEGADLSATIDVEHEVDFSFECPEILTFSSTHIGEVIQLYLSAKHRMPDITVQDIRNIPAEQRRIIVEKLYSLNDIGEESESVSKDELKKSTANQ